MAAEQRAALVVRGFVAIANRLSQGAGQSNCAGLRILVIGRPRYQAFSPDLLAYSARRWPATQPRTIARASRERPRARDREAGDAPQPARAAAVRRAAARRHRRLRRDGAAAAGQRDHLRPRRDHARRARPGQEPDHALAGQPPRRAGAGDRGLRDQRPPLRADLPPLPRPRRARTATRSRSRGSTATVATARSSRRRTSRSPTSSARSTRSRSPRAATSPTS